MRTKRRKMRLAPPSRFLDFSPPNPALLLAFLDRGKQKNRFLYGGLFSGPVGHGWQKLLGACFAPKKRGRKLREDDNSKNAPAAASDSDKTRELVLRVVADALIFGPLCNAAAISFIALALEKKTLSSVPAGLRNALPPTQLRAWRFWPLVSLIAYSKVPPKMRVPFFNCAGFVWGVILISGAGAGEGKGKKKRG